MAARRPESTRNGSLVWIDPDGDAAISVAASVGRYGINHHVQADEDLFWAQAGGRFRAAANGVGFFSTSVTLTAPCEPAASGVMTLRSSSADTVVFGLQVVTIPTSTVRGQAYLTRPHSLGTGLDI